MPRTSPYRIVLTEDERRHLEAAARRYTSPYRDVVRARIVLYAAEGLGTLGGRGCHPQDANSHGQTVGQAETADGRSARPRDR